MGRQRSFHGFQHKHNKIESKNKLKKTGQLEGGFLTFSDLVTLPETNIAPENGWLEDEFPFGMAYFQGFLLLVSGRVTVVFVIFSMCDDLSILASLTSPLASLTSPFFGGMFFWQIWCLKSTDRSTLKVGASSVHAVRGLICTRGPGPRLYTRNGFAVCTRVFLQPCILLKTHVCTDESNLCAQMSPLPH